MITTTETRVLLFKECRQDIEGSVMCSFAADGLCTWLRETKETKQKEKGKHRTWQKSGETKHVTEMRRAVGRDWGRESFWSRVGIWAYRAGLKPRHNFLWPKGRVAPCCLKPISSLSSQLSLGFPVYQQVPVFGGAFSFWVLGDHWCILRMLICSTAKVDLQQRYWGWPLWPSQDRNLMACLQNDVVISVMSLENSCSSWI